MYLDKFGIPIYSDSDVFELIYAGVNPAGLTVDTTSELAEFSQFAGIPFNNPLPLDALPEDVDREMQATWFMPAKYAKINIKELCLQRCNTAEEVARVDEEYAAFTERGMVPLLQWLVYLVDTCQEHNIVLGVGRGSSVSSYILFLLDVHCVNSLEYNLPWQEFLR